MLSRETYLTLSVPDLCALYAYSKVSIGIRMDAYDGQCWGRGGLRLARVAWRYENRIACMLLGGKRVGADVKHAATKVTQMNAV